jgi:uncharacterized protein (TIGR03067 family)
MENNMLRAAVCLMLGLFTLVVHAEVIELEGTIKNIDPDAMAITIVRKTPKGEKILELEIAKNAGDVSGFKEGDKIGFAYNPDAEIVTRIEKAMSDEAQADLKAFQGEWKNAVTEEGGKRLPAADQRRENRTLFIKGNTFRMERVKNGNFGFHEGKFSLDPENKFFDMEEPGGLTYVGIYRVTGDTLKLCYRVFMKGSPPHERPTDFKGIGDKAPLNYEYKKVKE